LLNLLKIPIYSEKTILCCIFATSKKPNFIMLFGFFLQNIVDLV